MRLLSERLRLMPRATPVDGVALTTHGCTEVGQRPERALLRVSIHVGSEKRAPRYTNRNNWSCVCRMGAWSTFLVSGSAEAGLNVVCFCVMVSRFGARVNSRGP